MVNGKRRRDFLQGMALACGAAMVDGSGVLAHAAPGSAASAARGLLPRPDFYWGVGIENCWIAQTDPQRDGNRRLLDVFLQMQHYEKWKEDLDRAAAVGVKAIRYSVPWYKAEPRPGVYDWSWIEKPVDYLVNQLKIIPVMDLVHYGTPTWMPDGILDERFPEALGKYTRAMASHFKGVVDHYTPHNEPQISALFCGLTGRWPPYHNNVQAWCRLGTQVGKAMIHASRELRTTLDNPVLISADVVVNNHVHEHFPKTPPQDVESGYLALAAASHPSALVYGKVHPDSPFAEFLRANGVPAADVEWCYRNAAPPDILGLNYYPDIFRFLQDGDYTRGGTVPLEQGAREAANLLERNLRHVQAYFDLPTLTSETSAGRATEAKIAYMDALHEMTQRLRREKFPIVGMIWWPLFQTIQWDYREKVDQPLEDFLYPGLWNNGLYVIDVQPDGDLKRVHTAAADRFRDIIRRDAR
jgi:beta-glucosidase